MLTLLLRIVGWVYLFNVVLATWVVFDCLLDDYRWFVCCDWICYFRCLWFKVSLFCCLIELRIGFDVCWVWYLVIWFPFVCLIVLFAVYVSLPLELCVRLLFVWCLFSCLVLLFWVDVWWITVVG